MPCRVGAVRNRRADRGVRPYGQRYKGCNGRATARVAPTEGYKRCGEVRYPPVTASPCQPPLGKGFEGTGRRGRRPLRICCNWQKTPPMPGGMRGEKIAVPLSFITQWGPFTQGRAEGVCIPRAPGRTFRAASQGGLQPVTAPLLEKLWRVLFPINALCSLQPF